MCKLWLALNTHFFAAYESHCESFWKPGVWVNTYICCAMFIIACLSSLLGQSGSPGSCKASARAQPCPPPHPRQGEPGEPKNPGVPPHSPPAAQTLTTLSELPAKPSLAASTPFRLTEAVGCSIRVLGLPCHGSWVRRLGRQQQL